MGKFWISSLIIITLLLVLANAAWFCYGCWEEERFALLQLKSNLNYPNGNSLPLWIDDNRSDCCEWSNVICDTTTKHVVQISLDYIRVKQIQGDWHFNASLFLPFKMLRALSLSQNGLIGWVENQGFEKLSELSKLKVLDLSGNNFDRSVLLSLGHLTSLKSLNLDFNSLDGSGHERLSSLKKLEFLSLRGTRISESNVQSIFSINDFTNLKELDITDNTFGIFGPMHDLSNLEILHAALNGFNKSIFTSLKQLPSLRFLDLSSNRGINGSVKVNELLALEDLDLSDTGVDNFVATKGLPNLKILHLGDNGFNNSIFSSLEWFPSLKFLDLSGNKAINGSVGVSLKTFKR
nr:LRR receptor-like serine/threonine-protein kinase GSO1 [Ipomoea batatas]